MVIESRKLHGLGQTSDVLVRWGALRKGDFVVVDAEYGKIRMLLSQDGEQVCQSDEISDVDDSFRASRR